MAASRDLDYDDVTRGLRWSMTCCFTGARCIRRSKVDLDDQRDVIGKDVDSVHSECDKHGPYVTDEHQEMGGCCACTDEKMGSKGQNIQNIPVQLRIQRFLDHNGIGTQSILLRPKSFKLAMENQKDFCHIPLTRSMSEGQGHDRFDYSRHQLLVTSISRARPQSMPTTYRILSAKSGLKSACLFSSGWQTSSVTTPVIMETST